MIAIAPIIAIGESPIARSANRHTRNENGNTGYKKIIRRAIVDTKRIERLEMTTIAVSTKSFFFFAVVVVFPTPESSYSELTIPWM